MTTIFGWSVLLHLLLKLVRSTTSVLGRVPTIIAGCKSLQRRRGTRPPLSCGQAEVEDPEMQHQSSTKEQRNTPLEPTDPQSLSGCTQQYCR